MINNGIFRYFSLVISVITVSAATTLVSCSENKSVDKKQSVSVGVYTVSGVADDAGREYVGSVVEREGTSLSFEVPGNIVALRADNGDRVAKGQLLATVNPATLRDAHQLALTTLRQAQDAYRRFEPLHKQGVLSDLKWVEVQTKLEQAESSERLARTQLSRTSLVAPFSGVISSRTAERGMNVMAGQQIFRLVDISKIDVKVSVPENEVSAVKIGAKARVEVSALGGRAYEAIVKEKGIEANPVSHTYDIKLAVVSNDGRLMPGMVCNVRMVEAADDRLAVDNSASSQSVDNSSSSQSVDNSSSSQSVDNSSSSSSVSTIISIPLNAVKLDIDNRRFVWLVVDGKAHQQYVMLGDFTENGVIVTSGLKIGDCVITDGSQKVSEGMEVSTDQSKSPTPAGRRVV